MDAATPSRRPMSSGVITALLSVAGLVVALQTTLVVPLLPDLPELLDVTAGDVGWLITITLLTGAVATPIVSRMADMYGKRRMMVLSLAMMVAGALIAAIGADYLSVLIGRGLQGFSSALIPVAMAVLRDVLPREKVAGAVAMTSSTMGIGGALGMPAAGALYDNFGWTSVFWVSAAVGATLMLGILLVVPASATGTRGRFDIVGALLLTLALTALLLGISKGPTWGWSSVPTVACFAVAIVITTVFVPYQLRVSSPMVDLRVSARRTVLLANLAGLFIGFSAYASLLATTQQLQLPEITGFGFGLSAATAGLCMIPGSLAMFLTSPIAGRLTTRFGGRFTLTLGTLVMTAAYTFRIAWDDTVVLIIIGAAMVSIGNALAYATLPALIMGAVPLTDTAAANGLNSLARTIGMSSMSAVVAALLTSITLEAAGGTFPAHGAIIVIFVIAGASTFMATLCAVFLPKHRPVHTTSVVDATEGA
ncbi:MFS transporter [Rhodococcus sp. NPDC060086]|uniref:MFS transporter n=1 Tax=unclassified Rhodococcus (in: high G+C Gram-positive bacteria) TaxID=192944 RepID=UPI0036586F07